MASVTHLRLSSPGATRACPVQALVARIIRMSAPSPFAVVLASALLLAGTLAACGGSAVPAPTTPANDGAIVADVGDEHCQQIPPEQFADYKAAHNQFSGPDGLTPLFVKGQLFHDNEEIRFKWKDADSKIIGIRVVLLRRCSESPIHDSPLYVLSPGSGEVSTPLYTGNAGSRYPSGTPALVQVTSTSVDAQKMTGTTTVIGQYTIRVEGPKD
jgi:hypothetical protein